MSIFAKIFDSEIYGQLVLIKQGDDESGAPELRVLMEPEGLGVCSVAVKYEDSDEGWDKCEACFKKADVRFVEMMAKAVFDATEQQENER